MHWVREVEMRVQEEITPETQPRLKREIRNFLKVSSEIHERNGHVNWFLINTWNIVQNLYGQFL